jgi:hypothetical protein
MNNYSSIKMLTILLSNPINISKKKLFKKQEKEAVKDGNLTPLPAIIYYF